jgi:undecaprenyl pyrophosphate phosphatase UppP
MESLSFFGIIFHSGCYLAIGILLGMQYVHIVEHQVRATRYSYVRYISSLVVILFLAWVVIKTGGLERKDWIYTLLPFFSIGISVVITVKILFKKKGMSFLDSKFYKN